MRLPFADNRAKIDAQHPLAEQCRHRANFHRIISGKLQHLATDMPTGHVLFPLLKQLAYFHYILGKITGQIIHVRNEGRFFRGQHIAAQSLIFITVVCQIKIEHCQRYGIQCRSLKRRGIEHHRLFVEQHRHHRSQTAAQRMPRKADFRIGMLPHGFQYQFGSPRNLRAAKPRARRNIGDNKVFQLLFVCPRKGNHYLVSVLIHPCRKTRQRVIVLPAQFGKILRQRHLVADVFAVVCAGSQLGIGFGINGGHFQSPNHMNR